MNKIALAREKVIVATLDHVANQRYLEFDPGSYSALASSEMSDDMLNEALTEYVEVVNNG